MAAKYLIVSNTPEAAADFAGRNKFVPGDWLYMKFPRMFGGKQKALAIFLDGWRERSDHVRMIDAANQAEIRGIRILHAAADEVLPKKI